MWMSQDAWYISHWCNWPAHEAWYMKNDTATEVRTCQCKFQLITFPFRTTTHVNAYKLSDTWSLLDRNENGNIRCKLKKSWMKSMLGLKILVNLWNIAIILHEENFFRWVRKIAVSDHHLCCVCQSIRMEQPCSHWIFMKFSTWVLFENLSRIF
jgi:hypothetical protein